MLLLSNHWIGSADDAGSFAFGKLGDLADREDLFALSFKGAAGLFGVFGGDDHDETDAVVEDAVHFMAVDVALFLKPVEDGRARPGLAVDDGLNAFGKNAGHVLHEAAARDVGHALDLHGLHDFENLLDVDAGGFHGAVGERGTVERHVPVSAGDFDHLADEREAVGVRAARGKAENRVARLDRAAVDDLVLFDNADGEACEVVFAFRIHARHFGGFAADQSAACEFAALGDTSDNAAGDVNVELAAGIVVEEEEAAGTLHEDVVDAHGNEVLADRVVTAELEGEHELGAHAVRAGDENRVLVFLADFEERAEAADGAEDARDHRALGKGLDAFNEFVAGIDGNAGSRVGKLAHGKYLE